MTADQQAIAKQLRIANHIEVLKGGASFLEETDPSTAKTETAKRRMIERNHLRREIKEGLEL
jgi:hypothetical protein